MLSIKPDLCRHPGGVESGAGTQGAIALYCDDDIDDLKKLTFHPGDAGEGFRGGGDAQ